MPDDVHRDPFMDAVEDKTISTVDMGKSPGAARGLGTELKVEQKKQDHRSVNLGGKEKRHSHSSLGRNYIYVVGMGRALEIRNYN